MIDLVQLGHIAASFHKIAVAVRRGRSGRNVKKPAMQKELHAAGQPKMNSGVFAYARGHKV